MTAADRPLTAAEALAEIRPLLDHEPFFRDLFDRVRVQGESAGDSPVGVADGSAAPPDAPPLPKVVDNRKPACVEAWPECASGEYNPQCCRFPKSCSAGERYADYSGADQPLTAAEAVGEAVLRTIIDGVHEWPKRRGAADAGFIDALATSITRNVLPVLDRVRAPDAPSEPVAWAVRDKYGALLRGLNRAVEAWDQQDVANKVAVMHGGTVVPLYDLRSSSALPVEGDAEPSDDKNLREHTERTQERTAGAVARAQALLADDPDWFTHAQWPAASAGGDTAVDPRELIHAERRRQITDEGWSVDHDREHGAPTLYRAAWCYLVHKDGSSQSPPPPGWPWAPEWWKPKDRLRNAVRAGALALAGLDVAQGEFEPLTGDAIHALAVERVRGAVRDA